MGAHLHPWVTPPHEEVVCLVNSYPCNLPDDLERRKLRVLSDAIEARLGRRATVYKAGRHGSRFERGGVFYILPDKDSLEDTFPEFAASRAAKGGD